MSMWKPELLVAPFDLQLLAMHEVPRGRQPPLGKVSFVQNLRKSDYLCQFCLVLASGCVVGDLCFSSYDAINRKLTEICRTSEEHDVLFSVPRVHC